MICASSMFNAFIKTNLNYCLLMWVNRNRKDIARVEKELFDSSTMTRIAPTMIYS